MKKAFLYGFLKIFLLQIFTFVQAQDLEKIQKLQATLKTTQGEEKVKTLNQLCWAYRASDFDKAAEYGNKALKLAKQLQYFEGQAEALNMMGVVKRNAGDYTLAFDLYQQALNIAEKHQLEKQFGYANNNLGEIYKYMGDFPRAISHTEKAVQIFEKLKDERGVSYGYIRLGEIYELQEQYASALNAFYASLRIRKKIGDASMIETSLNRIGNVYNQLGEYQSAVKYLTDALTMSKEMNDTKSIAENLSDLAYTYQQQGQTTQALTFAKEGLAIAQANGMKPVAKKASKILAQIYPITGDFKQAYQYQQLFIQYQDSILNEEELEGIQALEMRNALDKKDAEKQQLAREQELLRQADKALIDRQRWLIFLAIAGVGLLIAFGAFMVFSNRQKQKTNQALSQQKEEILQQKDVIEEKNKEIARINESRIKQIIDNAFDAIITLDEEGMVTTWSARAGVLFGWTEEEVMGLALNEIVFDTDAQQAFQQIWQNQQHIRNTERIVAVPKEMKAQNKYGDYFPVELIINRLEVKNEIFFTIFIRDITEMKRAREALLKSQEETLEALEANKQLILEQNEILEAKVIQRTKQIEEAKREIQKKNEDITSSIAYASRIQQAILPAEKILQQHFEEHFIWWQPRDLVGGDFYWLAQTEEKALYKPVMTRKGTMENAFDGIENTKTILAAVDCTGHGVPGALMSMLGIDALNHIVLHQNITEANKILEALDKEIKKVLKQEQTGNNDGMDMALIALDRKAKMLYFAGAKNPLIYIQNQEMHLIKGDKFPIGGQLLNREVKFTTHSIPIDSPTTVYLFSDGFQDQFGGEQGRKFMIKRLKELLWEIHTLPMEQQKEQILATYQQWVGEEQAQIDDILMIGLKLG